MIEKVNKDFMKTGMSFGHFLARLQRGSASLESTSGSDVTSTKGKLEIWKYYVSIMKGWVCHSNNGPPKIGSPRNEFFKKYGHPQLISL